MARAWRAPFTEENIEVTTQCDDWGVPMDIGGSLYVDEEGFLEVRHKRQRRLSEPDSLVSPLAAQPSRADRWVVLIRDKLYD